MLPPIQPLKIKDRVSLVFVEKGQIDVIDGAFVVVDEKGIRTQIPIGSITCLMLEPGTRISHRAVSLAATVGTLIIWIGEAGVRLYASGQPGGARSDRLLYQAKLALDEALRLKVVRHMYKLRFKEEPPERRSIEQLRGIEGARVRKIYINLANKYGIKWKGRNYNVNDWNMGDLPNRCISAATSCLYSVTEAAILAAGYAPAIGFIHTGKPLSFVYDIADIVKFENVVPFAFQIASKNSINPEREVRLGCRNIFRETKLLDQLVPMIDEVLFSNQLQQPINQIVPIAIPNKEGIGDAGHRN